MIWFHILLSRSLLIHFAKHSEQTEGSCKQETDIHAGGLIVAEKSSVHIMQVVGLLAEGVNESIVLQSVSSVSSVSFDRAILGLICTA